MRALLRELSKRKISRRVIPLFLGIGLLAAGICSIVIVKADRLGFRADGDACMGFLVFVMPLAFFLIGCSLGPGWRLLLALVFVVCWLICAAIIFPALAPSTETPIQWYGAICGFPIILIGFVWSVAASLRKWLTPMKPGYCQSCGYCLFGLTSHRCPECGTITAKEVTRDASPRQ